MKKQYIITLLLLLCSFFVWAETNSNINTQSLLGKITDTYDVPIIGATIYLPELNIAATSDSLGHYKLERLPQKRLIIQVSSIGYKTISEDIDLKTLTKKDFKMKESSVEMKEVVVTGVSRATEIKRNPMPMLVVSQADIEKSTPSNIIDAIANLPGISAITTGPNISKPSIHGLGYNRIITMEDGIRQEGQQWGDEHGIEVDQNSIDRVEIIKGPASLMYGSDAIGGVVNLLTAKPVPDGKIEGSFSSLYGTNNGLFNESLKLQGNHHGLVWGVTASYKAAKDYENKHDGRVYATNFNEKDFRAMIGLNRSWGHSYFNASVFDDLQAIPDGSRDSLTRKFTQQITEADTYRPIVSNSTLNSYSIPTLHQHVQLYRIYNNSSFNIGDGHLLVNLGYQYSHRQEFTHPEDADVPGLNLKLSTLTYDVKYDFDIANGYETTFGVNGMYQNNTLGYSTDFPIPAYKEFDFGPFFVEKKSFGKLDLLAGIRYDVRLFKSQATYVDTTTAYTSIYSGSNPTENPNVIQQFSALNKTFSGASGSFGATYNFSDNFLLKGNIARGFRAPSIAELSANGPDPGSQIYHVGQSDFKPEFSVQEDIGAFLTLPNVSASVEVFNNNIENYIFQQQMLDANGNVERVNSDGSSNPNGLYTKFGYTQTKARIMGGEFSLDIHPLSWLHFENSLTLTYGTNLGNNGHMADSLKYLPFIPPLHTHSELRVNFAKGVYKFRNMYASVGFDHFDPQDRYFAAYGTETYTPGYNLLSAGFGGNLVNAKRKKIIELFVEGTNLANVSYQSNMSRLKYFDNSSVPADVNPGIYNMGRNISLKVIVPMYL